MGVRVEAKERADIAWTIHAERETHMGTMVAGESELRNEVEALVAQAPAYMVIETLTQANAVAEYKETVRGIRKKIEERIGPIRESAHKTWKAIIGLMSEIDKRPAEIEAACNRMLAEWNVKEKERVAAEQKRLDEEARKAAAAEALAEGNARQAKAIESGKVAVVSTTVAAPVQKVAGTAMAETWQAEVTDLLALVKAAAAGKCPLEWVLPNEAAIGAVARQTKGTVTIPGVTIRKVTSPRSTRRG